MKRNIIQLLLSRYHRQLGNYVAIHPYYFIIIPIFLSLALSIGILLTSIERDYEVLFTPQNSRAYKERQMIESIFPMNTSSNFDMTKVTRGQNIVTIIILPKDGGSVLRSHIFSEIVELNRIVQNVTVVLNGIAWNYHRLCAKNDEECTENEVLTILEPNLERFHQGKFRFKFPYHLNETTFKVTVYATNLGGITMDEDGYVIDSKAIRIVYYFDDNNEKIKDISHKWETLVRSTLEEKLFPNVDVILLSYLSIKSEISEYTAESVHLIGLAISLMIIFSMACCMTNSWVRSKPWLGLAGCISSTLALAATFGTVGYCGIEYADIVIALPFLMIGLGMDDSFVLLSAWRRTDTCKTVEERLSEAYSEAAVSITITSMTNFLSFCLGIATPFLVVQIFCIYAAIAVFFTYLYQITFFGGCMALSGYREHRYLHPFTFTQVVFKGYSIEDTIEKKKDDPGMRFFRDVIGRCLTMPLIKGCIYILFMLSLGAAIWGCIIIEEGLDTNDVLHPNSNSLKFIKLNHIYFPEFSIRVHIVINTTLNYADPEIQQKLENITRKFESNPNIASGLLTESWLRFYLLMAQAPVPKFLLRPFDLSEKQDFIDGLDNVFFKFPQTKRLRNDVKFNENHTEIIASRFFLTCMGLTSKSSQRQVLEHIRKIVDESDIPMITHSLYFLFNEQILAVKTVFLQTIGVAAAAILVIFFIYIPDIKCALCVAATVVAVEIEAVGYLSFWGVNLDVLSMINLVMCIGFSINYPAHIAYAYFTFSKNNDANERLRMALYATGMPILQSSFSTILGIATLAFVPSYTFLVFLKSIFLIVLATSLHGIFVLPIMLNTCDSCCKKKRGENGRKSILFDKILIKMEQ